MSGQCFDYFIIILLFIFNAQVHTRSKETNFLGHYYYYYEDTEEFLQSAFFFRLHVWCILCIILNYWSGQFIVVLLTFACDVTFPLLSGLNYIKLKQSVKREKKEEKHKSAISRLENNKSLMSDKGTSEVFLTSLVESMNQCYNWEPGKNTKTNKKDLSMEIESSESYSQQDTTYVSCFKFLTRLEKKEEDFGLFYLYYR